MVILTEGLPCFKEIRTGKLLEFVQFKSIVTGKSTVEENVLDN